ncbi:hypothetical protein CHS0354_027253 [Potamilus streckersoni]|uniref:Uncharacterized protein n=1 Tax=Potamilus streckersoni TaxID=2493646 RepID=A0AAE0RYQ8_9BIVA|nr:hypothetical protein CHS0354_027253 [Potamilus streckersoni]
MRYVLKIFTILGALVLFVRASHVVSKMPSVSPVLGMAAEQSVKVNAEGFTRANFVSKKPIVQVGQGLKQNVSPKPEWARCLIYREDARGYFTGSKTVSQPRIPSSVIESVELIERKSYYSCEPREEKYGISENGMSWWVDKGCEAVFEIVECPRRS